MLSEISKPEFDLTHPLLEDMAAGLGRIFPDGELLGFYLGGSIALGGFNPATSDLDFVVIARDVISSDQAVALGAMHAAIRQADRNVLYRNHEGDYLTLEQAQHPAPGIVCPHFGRDGHFAVEEHGSELVIDLWKVRRSGFAVYGPSPDELVGFISQDSMLAAKVSLFKGWWLPKLERREVMGAGYQAYAVQTMARIYYGIREKDEVSKRQAAEWMASDQPQFAELLRAATDWQKGLPFDRQEQVYELIGFVRDSIGIPASG